MAERSDNDLLVALIEKHVTGFWKTLATGGREGKPMRVAIYGGGKHTSWLHSLVAGRNGPAVTALLDDRPEQVPAFWNCRAVKPTDLDPSQLDAIILSTDSFNSQLRAKSSELFGNGIRILDIYDGLPSGPYPHRGDRQPQTSTDLDAHGGCPQINLHLKNIREFEIDRAMAFMPANGKVLEIGAGAGWQAKILADKGYDVTAIDIASSNYNSQREWPVGIYDGIHIPFETGTFDMVYTSNTLEHIYDIEQWLKETRRVLKPDGTAFHFVPTSSWRIWTTLTGSIHAAKGGWETFIKAFTTNRQMRHGERGTLTTEAYYFSHFFWSKLFRKNGWEITETSPNRLFYTGYSILDAKIDMETRSFISHLLGNACRLYCIKPRPY